MIYTQGLQFTQILLSVLQLCSDELKGRKQTCSSKNDTSIQSSSSHRTLEVTVTTDRRTHQQGVAANTFVRRQSHVKRLQFQADMPLHNAPSP